MYKQEKVAMEQLLFVMKNMFHLAVRLVETADEAAVLF
jgi:hypothetical protein